MASDPVATRYAQAVFESAKAAGVLDVTVEQLTVVGTVIRYYAPLQALLGNPGLVPGEKVDIVERILKGSWSALVRSFVQLVMAFGRAELLPDAAQALQTMVDSEHKILRVTVRSAHPMPQRVIDRVRTRLERLEQKQVLVTTEVAGELLGGIQTVLGYQVIDSSVRRQLDDLRERLTSARVA